MFSPQQTVKEVGLRENEMLKSTVSLMVKLNLGLSSQHFSHTSYHTGGPSEPLPKLYPWSKEMQNQHVNLWDYYNLQASRDLLEDANLNYNAVKKIYIKPYNFNSWWKDPENVPCNSLYPVPYKWTQSLSTCIFKCFGWPSAI